jgi:hypothetical protein
MVLEGENWGEEKEVEVSDEVLGISFSVLVVTMIRERKREKNMEKEESMK